MSIAYQNAPIAAGIRSRFADNGNGLTMHYLEAGFEQPDRPLVVLLHGFPELAYSWRKIMPALADAGYWVVAPDQRGYGRTLGWDPSYDGDLTESRVMNLVRDVMGLVSALGRDHVEALVGHDFGAMVTSWAALLRPDVFRRCVLMSAPFAGPPALGAAKPAGDVHADLAALERPRKHYQWYYSTRQANEDMWRAPQGVHDFLRAYFHHKSADWIGNKPFRLGGWAAEDLARMPTYYVMDLGESMAETVAHEMPSPEHIAACQWMPDAEMAVFAAEYGRNGFQGGLQWYRARTSGQFTAEQQVFAGRTIDVPFLFVSGASDWGIQQMPGALEKMEAEACTDVRGIHLLEGAGHWVQQEQSEKVSELLLPFLAES
jgi:pimeloyl-ACP methyl ester carboxylesterase